MKPTQEQIDLEVKLLLNSLPDPKKLYSTVKTGTSLNFLKFLEAFVKAVKAGKWRFKTRVELKDREYYYLKELLQEKNYNIRLYDVSCGFFCMYTSYKIEVNIDGEWKDDE